MTETPDTYEAPASEERPANDCVRLLDAVTDMAIKGKIISVGIVMVDSPGRFRIAAAGKELGGLMAGAAKMQDELAKVIESEARKANKPPKLTVIHSQQEK